MVTLIFEVFVELRVFETYFQTSTLEIYTILGLFPILKQQ